VRDASQNNDKYECISKFISHLKTNCRLAFKCHISNFAKYIVRQKPHKIDKVGPHLPHISQQLNLCVLITHSTVLYVYIVVITCHSWQGDCRVSCDHVKSKRPVALSHTQRDLDALTKTDEVRRKQTNPFPLTGRNAVNIIYVLSAFRCPCSVTPLARNEI